LTGDALAAGTSGLGLAGERGGSPRSWVPLLDARLTLRALEVVHEIAQALRVPPPPCIPGSEQSRAIEDASLAGGRAGLAILYAYLARAGLADRAGADADEFLDEATAALGHVSMPSGLYSGFTGVAWAVAHLHDSREQAIDDVNEEVDQTLHEYLTRSPWTDDYDLVSGLVGIGVYAMERLPSRNARRLLALVVDRLDDTAELSDRGATWFTAPELLPDWQRQLCPHGYYNLGLAHGVPGVIALLSGSCAAGVARAKARPLLDAAVAWLLSQKLAEGAGSTFPTTVAPGAEMRPSRLAWCYGDPGIAGSLLAAARAAGVSSWGREAIEIARRSAARPFDEAGIRDAGLCHGAAGLAHIFNRMYQSTGDRCLSEAARFWFTQALDMRQPGRGIAGYAAWDPRADGTAGWKDDPGLLSGAAGIALALLAAVSPIEPAWDRMLLLSVPSRQLTSVS
jgi:lantibiotic modifying enzyme